MSAFDGRDAGLEVKTGLIQMGAEIKNGLFEVAKVLLKAQCLHSWMKPYHMDAHMVQECKHCFEVRLIF